MRIHLAQQARVLGDCMTPWPAEMTADVLVENSGVRKRDTVMKITGRSYFWRCDLYHLGIYQFAKGKLARKTRLTGRSLARNRLRRGGAHKIDGP
jgi:hypothetical protein